MITTNHISSFSSSLELIYIYVGLKQKRNKNIRELSRNCEGNVKRKRRKLNYILHIS